ncbi:uncharacterized protein LOC106753708 [Vigna radiata var. radiata]|uniref:Uncharacterized protein LOC106753708 n=1 Tax=Vigna radiata var. radiata TaxID=3916 RepID=A0A1S3TBA0_VIGRR|nr:uncharacterized protein LOC106753708 [Vigna radiata var. radiata]
MVLSASSAWIPKLLAKFHMTKTGGHSGVYRTYQRIAQSLYWVGIKKTITEYVARCVVCQQHKYMTASPQGLSQPLLIPQAVWEEISLDFIVILPKSQGHDAILVVVDKLSKYAHFVVLKHPFSAKTVAKIFTREIIKLHGIPVSIVSDRDLLFLSIFWREIFKAQGTQLKMSTTYHPEMDGYQGSARCTPFDTVYGRSPLSFSRFVPGETPVEAMTQDLMTRDETLKQLRFHLNRAQDLMAQQANKKRRKAQAARKSRIHSVFHVSQLKKVVGDKKVEKELPKELQAEEASFWPIRVLDKRQIQQGDEILHQVLVEWQEGAKKEQHGKIQQLFRTSIDGRRLEELTDWCDANSIQRFLEASPMRRRSGMTIKKL